jgi:hypothetical protein
MRLLKAFSQTFSQKQHVLGEAPSVASVETSDRTSSSDASSDGERDCESPSSTAARGIFSHVQHSTTIQEEEDGGISLVFDKVLVPSNTRVKKRRERSQRGRSRQRRNFREIPTNADAAAIFDHEKPSFITKKRRGKFRKTLNTYIRSFKGELGRMQRTRGQEIVVIDPVDTFEMNQELDRKVASVNTSGL